MQAMATVIDQTEKGSAVAGEDRFEQMRLGGEVVVKARLADLHALADVPIADGIRSPSLDQILGNVEDGGFRISGHVRY